MDLQSALLAASVASQQNSGQSDLSGYVKSTDYATYEVAGVSKVLSTKGIYLDSKTKHLTICRATEEEILEGKVKHKPLVPESIEVFMSDYGVETKYLIPMLREKIDQLEARVATLESNSNLPAS